MFNLESGRGSRRWEPRHRSSLICLWLVLIAAVSGCDPRANSASSENRGSRTNKSSTPLPDLSSELTEEQKDRERPRTGSPLTIAPKFVEVAEEVGLRHRFYTDTIPKRYFLPEVMGGGAAWLDFDVDGWLDVYYANGRPLAQPPSNPADYLSRMFRSRGDGTFFDVTAGSTSGVCRYGQSVSAGDYDADGFPDLFLANYDEDVLLHNLGDGTYEAVTNQALNVSDKLWGEGSAWWDADQDGDLDLYVVNYLDVTLANTHVCEYKSGFGFCGPGEYQAVPDYLYVNQGDGTFVESLDAYGMTADLGNGLVISVIDFDNDLLPEVYIGNDMTANFLFVSPKSTIVKAADIKSDKRYVEVGRFAGCAVSRDGLNEATMGIACADYNHDGLPDIYLTHFFLTKNTLYRNLGNLTFVDDSYSTQIAKLTNNFNGFGCVPIDYDRDSFSDILITNGHVLGPEFVPYEMTTLLLRNDGGKTFSDISATAGPFFKQKLLGRGLAGADYDNDGDLDATITFLDRPVALLRNETVTGRDYIGLEVRTWNRIPPVGGRIVVKHKSKTQVLPITAGGSYESSHDPRFLVGLADDHDPVTVQIYWPSGKVDEWNNLALNQYHVFYEGKPPRPDQRPAPDQVP